MTLAEGLSPWPVQVRPREPTSADAGRVPAWRV